MNKPRSIKSASFDVYDDGSGWDVSFPYYHSIISGWEEKRGLNELKRLRDWLTSVIDYIEGKQ